MRHVTPSDITDPGPWWIAHDYPERAVDDYCVWSWDCDACMLHLIAANHRDPGRSSEQFTHHDHQMTRVDTTVAATLAHARVWRAERGMKAL